MGRTAQIMGAGPVAVKLIFKERYSTAFVHQTRTCALHHPRCGEYLSRKNHMILIFEKGIIFEYAKFYFDANVVRMN
jgi:hypothetical protein